MDINIAEALDFVNREVQSKTGQPLTELQLSILEGTLKNQKYSDIGDVNGFSKGHVQDVGYELFQLLSQVFHKPLKKHNFKKFLKEQKNTNCHGFNFYNGSTISYSNYYSDCLFSSSKDESETSEYKEAKNRVQLTTAKKLRKKGLKFEEIAEILEIELEFLKKYLGQDENQ
ncbi:MAG: hypothetical protein IGQ45_02980 [Cyanobacterium sp. T60_A2020_053]|nr:hypothetical protein [Cyanobacterium sp. T60_A2020_053]